MITANPRPMSSAPLDGTPIRLFVSAGPAIASFWSVERCRKAFGTAGICSSLRGGRVGATWMILVLVAVQMPAQFLDCALA
jgi:hypothetical protein